MKNQRYKTQTISQLWLILSRLYLHFLIILKPRRRLKKKISREEEAMAGVGPMTQDWEPVVIRKKAPNAAAKRDEKSVNAARRSGADIETVRKCLFSSSSSSRSSFLLDSF